MNGPSLEMHTEGSEVSISDGRLVVLGAKLIVGENDRVGITDGAFERDGSLEDVGCEVLIG